MRKLFWIFLVLVQCDLWAASASDEPMGGAGGPPARAAPAGEVTRLSLSNEEWLSSFGTALDFSMALVQDNIIWISSLEAYWENSDNIAKVNAHIRALLPACGPKEISLFTKHMLQDYETEEFCWKGILRILQILEARTERKELSSHNLIDKPLNYILEEMDKRGEQLKSIAYAELSSGPGSNMFPVHLYPGNKENTQAQLESLKTIFERLVGFMGLVHGPTYIGKLRDVIAKIQAPLTEDLGHRSRVKGTLILGGGKTGPARFKVVELNKGRSVRSEFPDFGREEVDVDILAAEIEGVSVGSAPLSKNEKKRRAKASTKASGPGVDSSPSVAAVTEPEAEIAPAFPSILSAVSASAAGGVGSSARRMPLGPIDAKLKEIILRSRWTTRPMPERFTPSERDRLSDKSQEMLANLLGVNGARDYGNFKSIEKYTWDNLETLLGELGFTRRGTHFVYVDEVRQIGLHYLHKGNQLHHDMVDIMFGQLHAIGFTRPRLGTLLGLSLGPWSWESDRRG